MNTAADIQPPVTHFLSAENSVLAYEISGEGPLILMIPGMGEIRSTYNQLRNLLVRNGYQVALMDLRGHGDSGTDFAHYGVADTARDIEALLREIGQPGIVIGNSLAASASVLTADAAPELITGLIFTGPFLRNPRISPLARLALRIMTMRPWAGLVWKAYMPTLYAGQKPENFSEHRQRVATSLGRPSYARAFSQTVREVDHSATERKVGLITPPVLILMGSLDPDFKDPQAEAQWAAQSTNGEYIMIDDAGHYPHAQQPEASFSGIKKFLDKVHARG